MPGGTKENYAKLQSQQLVCPAEVATEDLPNTSLEYYC
jgi:hypothetical protein